MPEFTFDKGSFSFDVFLVNKPGAKKNIAHYHSHIVLKKQTSLPNHHATLHKKPMYRDTRLGSSSKKYNTYKKNDNGAGAITTNPKK